MSLQNVSDSTTSAPGSEFARTDESVKAPASLSAAERAARARKGSVNRTSASRVRRRDFNAISGEIRSLVKTKPGFALAGAAVLGFLLGRAFSPRS
jgi:hypothetical protein